MAREYASYLLRLWRTRQPDRTGPTVWCAEAECIQTGERRRFLEPSALLAFLNLNQSQGEDNDPSEMDDAT